MKTTECEEHDLIVKGSCPECMWEETGEKLLEAEKRIEDLNGLIKLIRPHVKYAWRKNVQICQDPDCGECNGGKDPCVIGGWLNLTEGIDEKS